MSNTRDTRPIRIFMSYSPEQDDEELAEDLRKYLAPLVNQGIIVLHDRSTLFPGQADMLLEEWQRAADLILMLISPDSLVDADCIEQRRRAMERHDRQDAQVIPVLLRPAMFDLEPWAGIRPLPSNGRALTEWRQRDRALLDIAKGIRGVLDRFETARSGSSTVLAPRADTYFLNHTSFLRPEKQAEFQRRTQVQLPHYDIRVVVDSYDEENLDRIERVEYILDPSYPEPTRVRAREARPLKFLLKELAHGEYVLHAKVYIKNSPSVLNLYRYITLWPSGPELP